MLTTRIIAVINILNDIAVQSINFKEYLPVGRPEIAISYLNNWGVDEIVVLNIKGSLNSGSELYKYLPSYVTECQAPITAGGGVKNLNDIENLIRNGADKAVINSCVHDNPRIIEEGAKEFGEQAIVVSVDVRKINNNYVVYKESGSLKVNKPFIDVIMQAQDYGAGEIFINSIDRDGSKQGYDLELLDFVNTQLSIPVVGCGGVGVVDHFKEAVPLRLSGLAAGNYFHYTEHCVILTKSYLNETGEDIRIDSYAKYNQRKYAVDGRLMKLADNKLEELKFVYIPEEKI